jgi:hypothetical protein
VENDGDPFKGPANSREITDVGFDEFELAGKGSKIGSFSRDQIVDHSDIRAPRNERATEMRSDKTGAPGHEKEWLLG